MWLCVMVVFAHSCASTPVPDGTTWPASSMTQSAMVTSRAGEELGEPVSCPLPTRTPPMPSECSQERVMEHPTEPSSNHTA